MNLDAFNIERGRDLFERQYFFYDDEDENLLKCSICGEEFEDRANHEYLGDKIICEYCLDGDIKGGLK